MRDEELRELAASLAAARRKGELIPNPTAWPETVEEAYHLQDLAVAAYREEGCGWKVGATNDAALANFKLKDPFLGPLLKLHCYDTGATLPANASTRGTECEIAFRLNKNLPAKDGGHDRAAVEAAIGGVHPAIEVAGTRLDGPGPGTGLGPIGDFGGNVAFASGAAIEDWQDLALAEEEVQCLKNGDEVATGRGDIVLGNPVNSIVWLTKQGIALKSGDIISTGTLTGLTPVTSGDTIEARFKNLGSVTLTIG